MRRLLTALIGLVAFTVTLTAQQAPTGFPPGITLPVFVVPASAVNGAGTASGPIYFPDGAVGAPSITFTSATTRGLWLIDANTIGMRGVVNFTNLAGTPRVAWNRGDAEGFAFGSSVQVGWWDNANPGAAGSALDLILARDAANILTQRNGTNAQTMRIGPSTGYLSLAGSNTNATISVSSGGINYSNIAPMISATAPTVSSGFGTTPSITASNGTAAFTVDVGTGGTASAGVLAMPTATTGWNCHVDNRTGVAANRADQRTVQTTTTVSSLTIQNQTISTGSASAWAASDVLALICISY